jgi:hypothetical protein
LTFDWTISFGQILQVLVLLLGGGLTAVKFYYALDKRVSALEAGLRTTTEKAEREIVNLGEKLTRETTNHADAIKDHAMRMERWEMILVKLVGDLQRVIGEMTGLRRASEDRRGDRRDAGDST